jgi:protein O-mannosyl-transferase
MGRARKRKLDRGAAAAGIEQRGRGAAGEARPAMPAGLATATLACLTAILAVGAAVYVNSFSIPFLFDDYFAIVGNKEVRSLEPVARFFTQSRGLPHLLDTLNYRWGGEEVWGYHLVNVAVHLINGVLVFALALLTLRLPLHGGRYDSRARVLALLTALVFVVHPLQTQAVSYIVQRAESVAALFYLGAVLVYAAGHSARIGLSGLPLAIVVLALGFLGIASKETVASLPAALLLYHVCFLRRSGAGGADWRWALLLVLPVLYGIYLARHFLLPGFGDPAGGQSSWMYIPTAGLGVDGITPWTYLITQFGVVVWYLRLFILPTQLTFDYGWPFATSFWSLQVLAPLLVLLALAAVAVLAYSRYRWATFAVGWLFVTLAPSSSVIPIKDAAFEYRMYLPIVALALLAVVGISDLARRAAAAAADGGARPVTAIVVGLWIAALAVGTVLRNQTLADELTLARDSAAKAPWHWRNQYGLGAALLAAGETEEATVAFERAVELSPEHHTARIMLADLLSRAGRLDDAEEVLLPATEAREESVSAAAYRQLGFVYKAKGYPDAAIAMFEEAMQRRPKWSSLHLQIARLMRHNRRFHDAAFRLNVLVGREPDYANRLGDELAQTNLLGGVESFERGEVEFARHMLSVARGNPKTLVAATRYLAYVEARSGDRERAIALLADLEQRGLIDTAGSAELERLRAGEEIDAPLSTPQS